MLKILVVGGIPNPIGGVTTFIYRLLENNIAIRAIDIYPSCEKKIPKNFIGELVFCRSFINFYSLFVFSKKIVDQIDSVHFNFSTPSSLPFLFLLPKRHCTFYLMLHHGTLKSPYPKLINKLLLSKFDKIYSISEEQDNFYKKNIGNLKKVFRKKSYLPVFKSSLNSQNNEIKKILGEMKTLKEICIISGYCQKIYNHHWVIDLFSSIEQERGLLVFLYGSFDEEYYNSLRSKVNDLHRIKFFINIDQESFNFALSHADIYLRPNLKDSFGIAVADAVSFGVKVLASDVCDRYPGSYLFTPSSYENFVDSYLNMTKNPSNISTSKFKKDIFHFSYE